MSDLREDHTRCVRCGLVVLVGYTGHIPVKRDAACKANRPGREGPGRRRGPAESGPVRRYPMSTEPRRTLVVSRDHIEELDHKLFRLSLLASSAETRRIYEAQRGVLASLLREGTTVPLDYLTVVEIVTPVRETPWQRQQRDQERVYSEAQAADWASAEEIDAAVPHSDWMPAGGAA